MFMEKKKKKKMRRSGQFLSVVAIFLFCLVSVASAAVIERVVDNGKEIGLINWTMGVLMVEASAGPKVKNAEQTALNEASQKLMKLISKVRVTAKESVADIVSKDKALEKQMSDMVKKQMITKVTKHADGKVDVRAHLLIHQPTGPFELIYRSILKK